MRYGSQYAAACLHPLAEQLAGALDVSDNQVVCDLLCDGAPLLQVVAPELLNGTVIAVDHDVQLAMAAAAGAARGASCAVRAAVTDGSHIELPDESCDRVSALLTLGFGDADALLAEARRIIRPAGRIACLMWDPATPPPHEATLNTALREVANHPSPFLTQVLAHPGDVPGFTTSTLRDVVRFDGFNHYWHALVTERPLGKELVSVSAHTLEAVRARVAAALQPYAAADGTMRVPVSALLIRLG